MRNLVSQAVSPLPRYIDRPDVAHLGVNLESNYAVVTRFLSYSTGNIIKRDYSVLMLQNSNIDIDNHTAHARAHTRVSLSVDGHIIIILTPPFVYNVSLRHCLQHINVSTTTTTR